MARSHAEQAISVLAAVLDFVAAGNGAVAVNFKQPFCIDVSHWKSIPDFHAITPRPFLFITKASEGVSFVDQKFVEFMAGAKSIGAHRGCFHFHRKIFDGAGQARHFLSVINGYVDDDTILILDVEEGGESAAQLREWFRVVQVARPRNRVMLYSRRNILSTIAMTASEREFFRRISTWPAGYPDNPDNFDSIPSFYVPDPTRWGEPLMWQYSKKGQVTGIIGDVDLNWIDPDFVDELGGAPEPPPTGGSMSQWYRVDVAVLNIREGAGMNYADIGNLYRGDIVEAVGQRLGSWTPIENVLRMGGEMEHLAVPSWCNVSPAYVSPVPPPPVVPQPEPPTQPPMPDVLWIGTTRESVKEYKKSPVTGA